jgi:hypothetical protein
MVNELDTVVLTHTIEEHGLEGGDIGAVVHCFPEGAAFEVEFLTAEGKTIVMLTLKEADVRPLGGSEILHVREFTPV